MIMTTVEMLACFCIIAWIIHLKKGNRFSSDHVIKLLLFGMLPVIIPIYLDKVLPETSDAMPEPVFALLKAVFISGLLEEGIKYIAFRCAVHKSGEVVTKYDAILSAVLTGMGFVILDNILYTVTGAALIHAVLLVHILFGVIMGYFYARAVSEKKMIYHVLALLVPVLMHALFDIWPIMGHLTTDQSVIKVYFILTMVTYGIFLILLVIACVKLSRWHVGGGMDAYLDPSDKTGSTGETAAEKSGSYADPESLDDYIRVTSPRVWVSMIGLVILVGGVLAWTALGSVDNRVTGAAVSENGVVTCYMPAEYIDYLTDESSFTVGDQTVNYNGETIRRAIGIGAEADRIRAWGYEPSDVVAIELPLRLEEGTYKMNIIIETVSPIKLIMG